MGVKLTKRVRQIFISDNENGKFFKVFSEKQLGLFQGFHSVHNQHHHHHDDGDGEKRDKREKFSSDGN